MKKPKKLLKKILFIFLIFNIFSGCALFNIYENNDPTFNGRRYRRIDKSMNWFEAKAYCESLGGYLATITSASEQAFIMNLIRSGSKDSYWIGGFNSSYGWQWVNGESWTYSNWSPGEPNNWSNIENYTIMMRVSSNFGPAGTWNDIHENASGYNPGYFFSLNNIGFICEWD